MPRYIGSPSFDSNQPYVLHVHLSREPTADLEAESRAGRRSSTSTWAPVWSLLGLLGILAIASGLVSAKRLAMSADAPSAAALDTSLDDVRDDPRHDPPRLRALPCADRAPGESGRVPCRPEVRSRQAGPAAAALVGATNSTPSVPPL